MRRFTEIARRGYFALAPQSNALREVLQLKEDVLANPGNKALEAKLEHAATAAGRAAMAAERFDDACRAWDALRVVDGAREAAERNLTSAALKGARSAEEREDFRPALQCWRYLIAVEPQSEAARQGILRCVRALVVAGAKSSVRIATPSADQSPDEATAEKSQSASRGAGLSLLRFVSGDPAKAVQKVQQLNMKLLADPTNAGLKAKFERSAALGGRATMLAERYDDACSIWSSMRRIDPGNKLALRNLASAALKGARKAEAAGRYEEALRFWRYLKEAEPQSSVAAKGISRCSRFVA